MRLFPIITALLVGAVIFLFVFQRDMITSQFAPNVEVPVVETPAVIATDTVALKDNRIGVVVLKSQAQRIDSAVAVRGQTEAARQVNLVAETSGKVISVPLRKGTMVTAGQAMCRLDPGTRGASLAEAKARLAEAQARVPEAEARVIEAQARLDEALINDNAAEKLKLDGFASQTRVLAAQAATKSARAGVAAAEAGLKSTLSGIQSSEAAVAGAEKEIERLTIYASFDGVLESDTAELGSLLQPGALCATVIQLDPINLVGFVPEISINRIKLDALAGARLTAGDDVTGQVTFISRSADQTTRTFRVEIEVSNTDLAIRDGQTADILIQSEGAEAHLLPGSALTLDDNGTLGVRVMTADSRAKFTAVNLVRDTTKGVWVNGLGATANVIVVGQEFVVDGVEVAPTYREIEQ